MFETARQLHFTHSLAHFSARLDELLLSARLHQAQLPPELLDEIAFTTGELMLVLMNHPAQEDEALIAEALSHAQNLRQRLRTNQRENNLLTEECESFNREIEHLIQDSKKAA